MGMVCTILVLRVQIEGGREGGDCRLCIRALVGIGSGVAFGVLLPLFLAWGAL